MTSLKESNSSDFLPILNWIDGVQFKKTLIILGKRTNKFLANPTPSASVFNICYLNKNGGVFSVLGQKRGGAKEGEKSN